MLEKTSPECPCGCGPMVFCIDHGDGEPQSFVWSEHQAQLFVWLCEKLQDVSPGSHVGMTEAPQPMTTDQLCEVLKQFGKHPAGKSKAVTAWCKYGNRVHLAQDGRVMARGEV